MSITAQDTSKQRRRARIARPLSPLVYSLDDAASALGIGTTKLSELIKAGELPTITIGRRRLVDARDLSEFIRVRRALAAQRV